MLLSRLKGKLAGYDVYHYVSKLINNKVSVSTKFLLVQSLRKHFNTINW